MRSQNAIKRTHLFTSWMNFHREDFPATASVDGVKAKIVITSGWKSHDGN
jgi:hypothetical protein